MARRVHILDRREVFGGFFRIDEVRLQYERFDGSMSAAMTRLVLDRGDAVAILLHDPRRQLVLLCEQFRLPAYDHDGPGWLLEIPAGVVEPGERPEDCARREAREETGYIVQSLGPIATVYPSPGGSSERISIFSAEIAVDDRVPTQGGNVSEGEDIRVVALPIAQAFEAARTGGIQDAKTLIAIQWLELRR